MSSFTATAYAVTADLPVTQDYPARAGGFPQTMPAAASPAFDGMPAAANDDAVLRGRDRLGAPLSLAVKTALDMTAAAILLLLLSPVLAAIAIAVRRDGGPAIFGHRRLGQGGRTFRCLKFRTMVTDADRVLRETLASDPARAAEWAATQKLRDDPRVTRLGNFLRRTSLDELPQLFNVLRLEMSLVGPRPIVNAEVPFYGPHIQHYYAARPGLTGLWQVSGRSSTSYAYRVQLDVRYVTSWSVRNDITVLLRTIPAVLLRKGAC